MIPRHPWSGVDGSVRENMRPQNINKSVHMFLVKNIDIEINFVECAFNSLWPGRCQAII